MIPPRPGLPPRVAAVLAVMWLPSRPPRLPSTPSVNGITLHPTRSGPMSAFYVGEGLVIEGSDLNNVAHIDLLIGPKDGPVGVAFANALANQSSGHTNLLAVVSPNLVCKPATVMITKVTLKGSKQVMQMFGPAQAAVARAVVDSVAEGVIPKDKADDYVIVCGVFIAGNANDNANIYKNNYAAVRLAIVRAMKNEPKIEEIIAKKETAHPF